MTDAPNRYAQSLGIKLLEQALQQFGPIFTLQQVKPIANAMQISTSHLYILISALARSGWIEIIKRGVYVVRSPIYAGDIPPYAIAAALVQPMAISHWSALAHHGFTTQSPVMIQASTPQKIVTPEMRHGQAYRPRGRAVWRVYGLEFEFIYTKKHFFWGNQKEWVNSWQQVNITDPERTALDLIARSDIFGGIQSAGEILEESLDRIDVEKLVSYAMKYHVGAVIKRLGWLLENMGVACEQLEVLQKFSTRSYYLLDTTQPKSTIFNARWHINENVRK